MNICTLNIWRDLSIDSLECKSRFIFLSIFFELKIEAWRKSSHHFKILIKTNNKHKEINDWHKLAFFQLIVCIIFISCIWVCYALLLTYVCTLHIIDCETNVSRLQAPRHEHVKIITMYGMHSVQPFFFQRVLPRSHFI